MRNAEKRLQQSGVAPGYGCPVRSEGGRAGKVGSIFRFLQTLASSATLLLLLLPSVAQAQFGVKDFFAPPDLEEFEPGDRVIEIEGEVGEFETLPEGVLIIDAPVIGTAPALVTETEETPPATSFEEPETGEDRAQQRFPGGAPLKTDPDLEFRLKRAAKFAEEGRYDVAAVWWQKVLDDAGDTLVTSDGRVYTSLTESIEQTIAQLPPAGLRVYRITADGEAKALLASAKEGEEELALAEVVRRYFMSSLGDEAAYQLGCHSLDHHDFVGASRLFLKLLNEHPDSDIPAGEVLLRLAVAGSRVGDAASAEQSLGEIEKLSAGRPDPRLLDLVKRDVEKTSDTVVAAGSRNWPMEFGGPARQQRMQSIPSANTKGPLTELWSYRYPLNQLAEARFNPQVGEVFDGGFFFTGPDQTGSQNSASLAPVVNRWKNGKWFPTGRLLFDEGRVYFKTSNDLTCWSTAPQDQVVWRSAWINDFSLDSMTRAYMMMGVLNQFPNRPNMPAEVLMFGDRVRTGMSISQGRIYSIEGRRSSRHNPTPSRAASSEEQYQYGVVPRRGRTNWLAAYESRTGKAVWHRGIDSDEADAGQAGFLAPPVPYGQMLLVPVVESSTVWLYALSSETGETVWKTYLCDEPNGGTAPWARAEIAIEGREAYLSCGTGVLFTVDAVSGAIRLAVRYQRNGRPNPVLRNYGISSGVLDLEGWDDDFVIPYGRVLIACPSDHDEIFAVDRRSGDILWRSPRTSPFGDICSYGLGLTGRVVENPAGGEKRVGLVVAGNEVVRCHDVAGGKLLWSQKVPPSFGRGLLTEDAIYIPGDSNITMLSTATGEILSTIEVSLTSNEPVGSLFSDGERLWVVGAAGIYALTGLGERFEQLKTRIASGDGAAHFERMQLYHKLGKTDLALADLRAGGRMLAKNESPLAGVQGMIEGAQHLGLAETNPVHLLRLFQEAFVGSGYGPLPSNWEKEQRSTYSSRNYLVAAALRKITQDGPADHADLILNCAPLFSEDYLLGLAKTSLAAASAGEESTKLLAAAVSGDNPARQLLACELYAARAGEEALDRIAPLLQSEQDAVRLVAARSLVNLGERKALPVLVDLLASNNRSVRLSAAGALKHTTGAEIKMAAYLSPKEQAPAIKEWKVWLAENGATVELKRPLPEFSPLVGRTLICSYNDSRVIEVDDSGRETWRIQLDGAWGVQGLPNGHRLIACYGMNRVVEYNAEGEIVLDLKSLPGNPFSARRTPEGTTVVSFFDQNKVIEYNAEGNAIWEIQTPGNPRDARRLENGNTLVTLASTQKVVEYDREGNAVWEVSDMKGPMSAERLENGNTLVTQLNEGRVVEVDLSGKTVWQKDGVNQPYQAQRLPSGNTLIAHNEGIMEIEPSGKVVSTKRSQVVTGVHRF